MFLSNSSLRVGDWLVVRRSCGQSVALLVCSFNLVPRVSHLTAPWGERGEMTDKFSSAFATEHRIVSWFILVTKHPYSRRLSTDKIPTRSLIPSVI